MNDSYMERLRDAAKDDLTAFAEYINPDEPPAFHHRFLCDKLMAAERGDLMRMLVSLPPGAAKPVRYDSLLKTEHGNYKEIQNIAVGDKVLTHKGRYRKVLATHNQGILSSYKITTKSGREVFAAEDHPFLTPDGWKKLIDLSVGESLAAIIPDYIEDTSGRSLEEFRLLGYILGDGCVTKHYPKNPDCDTYNFNFTNNDPWILQDFINCVDILGFSHSSKDRKGVTRVTVTKKSSRYWLKESGVAGLNSHTKKIPDWAYLGSVEKQAALVGAYFNCDGTVCKKGLSRKSLAVEYSSVSKNLLRGTQRILQTLGIRSTLAIKHSRYKGEKYYSERLTIVGDSTKKFIDITGMTPYKKDRCLEWNPQQKRFYSNIIEDEIISLEIDNPCNMFCLTVEEDESFTVDHIAVHNSTYCSRLYPAWYLGRNPRKKFVQAGHTQNFVESQFGKKTRDIIDSQPFRDIFPEVRLATDSRAAGLWSLNNPYGGYAAKGVGQAIAGFRANMAVVDDPVGSRADAESETTRQAVFDWFSADFTTRLLPNSPLFVVATRWHSDDLCGRIEEMMKEGKGLPYEIINIPAIAEDEENDPLGRAPGEPLWPEFTPIAFYTNLKETLPSRDWNSLYQGTPVDENAGIVKAAWFKRYSGDIRKQVIPVRFTVSVDTASKAKERNDYTAVLTWMQDTLGNHYLLDVTRKKLEFTEMCVLIDSTARRFGASAILVEDKGSGTQYIQTRQGLSPAAIIPIAVNNQDSKEFRFDSVTPMFEAGNVFLPDRALWLADYEKELQGFPFAKYDDQVDATSQYLSWARVKKNVGGTSKLGNGASSGNSSNAVKMVESALKKLIEEKIRAKQLSESR